MAVNAFVEEDLYREHERFLHEVRNLAADELDAAGLRLESVSVLALQPHEGAEAIAGGQAGG